jgi:hypothetical protein
VRPSLSARRFNSTALVFLLLLLRTSYLSSVPGVPLLSALPLGRAGFGLNNPSPSRIEKLHPHRIAVAMQWLAVRHSSQRTKLSGARRERQRFAFFPSSRADNACASRAHVFGKCRFRTLRALVAVENNRNFHQDPALIAVKRKELFDRHGGREPHRHAAILLRFWTPLLPRCFMP